MGVRIFISYRRDDSSHVAGRLSDRLRDAFGEEHVFYDVESINPGDDFREVIIDTLALVDLVLVVIGPNWQPERLQSQADYVRIEISEALRQGKRVVPVLLDDVSMPSAEQLPPELAKLAFLNATRLRRDPDFRGDSGRIVEFLRSLDAKRSRPELSDPAARTPSALVGVGRQLRSKTIDGSAL
ncbi:MAG TPA: toll/interleukin-1 receptor domain-containing protein, partial [Ilumatobacteraceae bacterium]